MLDVQEGDVAGVEITCRSKFHVGVPVGLDGVQKLEAIREAFDAWLCDRALHDLERFAGLHEATLRVQAAGYRLSDARSRWGSGGRDNVIRVHWRLVQAPSPAFEYVGAHEHRALQGAGNARRSVSRQGTLAISPGASAEQWGITERRS